MTLSIIIPVYNEEKTVQEIIKQVMDVSLSTGINKEIIVVNDGSTDRTRKILNTIKNRKIKILHHSQNKGKGAAVRTGFGAATGEILIIQDADLEYNPNDFVKLLKPILINKARVVYGTRLKDYKLKLAGRNKTVLPTHLIANKVLTSLTNILYGSSLTDMETCYKLFITDVIRGLNLKSNKFDIEPEITAKILKNKIDIFEVPIKVNPRTHKEGKKISWKDGFSALVALIKYRFID